MENFFGRNYSNNKTLKLSFKYISIDFIRFQTIRCRKRLFVLPLIRHLIIQLTYGDSFNYTYSSGNRQSI